MTYKTGPPPSTFHAGPLARNGSGPIARNGSGPVSRNSSGPLGPLSRSNSLCGHPGTGDNHVMSTDIRQHLTHSTMPVVENDCIWLVVWNMNFIFPYIGNNHPNWLIFFRGVQTTNQFLMGWPCLIRAGNLNGLYQLRLREYKSQCSAENPSTVDEGIDLDTKNPRSFECVHYIIKRMSSVGQSSFQAVLAISSIWIHSHWDFSQKRFSQSETSKLRKLVIHEVKLDHLRMVVDVL